MPRSTPRPTLALTMGDPLGIGPEIVVKALADPALRSAAFFDIYGDEAALSRAAAAAGIPRFWFNPDEPARTASPDAPVLHQSAVGHGLAPDRPGPTAEGGRMSYECLLEAIDSCANPARASRRADALVTAPISKEAWRLAGIHYPGHTEVLADRLNAPRSAMLFVGPTLRVILVTIHVPLRDVPGLLTTEKVLAAIQLGAQACRELGVPAPRIAVAGLNPHAGERGLFGPEDDQIIAPAVARAQAEGIAATGPHPGDAVFLAAAKGSHDLVVAMYHDQGLIPVKLIDREHAVNVTAGLPIIRTSPAHGTAYDIAARNTANPASMRAAMELAIRMATARTTARAKASRP